MIASGKSRRVFGRLVFWFLVICHNELCGILVGGGATVNRTELQRLGQERISNTKVLLDASHRSDAYYLAGYGVECALKACIAKRMKSEEFPDKTFAEKCWTHNLSQLVAPCGNYGRSRLRYLESVPEAPLPCTRGEGARTHGKMPPSLQPLSP